MTDRHFSFASIGLRGVSREILACTSQNISWERGPLDSSNWSLLDDTFPGNLALFRPDNVFQFGDEPAKPMVRKEPSDYRGYTAASICTNESHLFGRFEVVLKASKGSSLVNGVFLHRNNPRQEIDLEILGKDTTKLLTNVYFNPGSRGANFDYGYRGTPVLIDLGFDASADFHRYTIEWTPTTIRWLVDRRLVSERAEWNPTPIPNLPMKFYVNLWPSGSREFAGRFIDKGIPASSELRKMAVTNPAL